MKWSAGSVNLTQHTKYTEIAQFLKGVVFYYNKFKNEKTRRILRRSHCAEYFATERESDRKWTEKILRKLRWIVLFSMATLFAVVAVYVYRQVSIKLSECVYRWAWVVCWMYIWCVVMVVWMRLVLLLLVGSAGCCACFRNLWMTHENEMKNINWWWWLLAPSFGGHSDFS